MWQTPRRQAVRRTRPGLLAAASAGTGVALAAGLQLRSKANALEMLEDAGEEPDPDHLFLALRGVELDDATRRAASAHARRNGLDVVDLVPGDLDAERAGEVVSWIDPATFRADRLAFGQGPTQAMLVHRALAEQAKPDVGEDLDVTTFLRSAEAAKTTCGGSVAGVAVAPRLAARPLDPAEHASVLRAKLSWFAPSQVGADILVWLALGYGAVAAGRRRTPWPLAPLVAHALQPLLAFTGTGLRPADLGRATWLRWPRRLVRLLRTQRALLGRDPDADAIDAQRPVYDDLLAAGTRVLFEPRRTTCYLCASPRLSVAVTSGDLHRLKPGTFRLERCGDCGHVFQNPPLGPRGLEVYYRDFYDGLWERRSDQVTEELTGAYRARAEMLRGLAEPARWLDVGAGNGRFCLVAGDLWPRTRFDGLDMRAAIGDAQRRGWLDRAHHGELVDLAADLAGTYDVLSMLHYLEHTRDPRAELAAARTVLRPGGHLLIEVPDPECPAARLLGRLWNGWQPFQHLHLLTIGNLESLLTRSGYRVVRRARREAHMGRDVLTAAGLAVQRLVPPDLPWRPAPGTTAELRHGLGFGLAGPLLAAAALADLGLDAATRAMGRGNAYRIVAQASGAG